MITSCCIILPNKILNLLLSIVKLSGISCLFGCMIVLMLKLSNLKMDAKHQCRPSLHNILKLQVTFLSPCVINNFLSICFVKIYLTPFGHLNIHLSPSAWLTDRKFRSNELSIFQRCALSLVNTSTSYIKDDIHVTWPELKLGTVSKTGL